MSGVTLDKLESLDQETRNMVSYRPHNEHREVCSVFSLTRVMNLNPLDISIIFKDSLLPEKEVSLGIFKL